jgi:hypothetical protein
MSNVGVIDKYIKDEIIPGKVHVYSWIEQQIVNPRGNNDDHATLRTKLMLYFVHPASLFCRNEVTQSTEGSTENYGIYGFVYLSR